MMTYDLSNPDKLTVAQMPDGMFGAMVLARMRGEVAEIWDDRIADWYPFKGKWREYCIYRIRPYPARPMTVDPLVWRVLDEKRRWIARDEDGGLWAYTDRPTLGKTVWASRIDDAIRLDFVPGLIDPGTCDWTEAIVERPE